MEMDEEDNFKFACNFVYPRTPDIQVFINWYMDSSPIKVEPTQLGRSTPLLSIGDIKDIKYGSKVM